MTLCMLWHRQNVEQVLKGANQIKVLQTGSKKLKPVPTLCFYNCARKLSRSSERLFLIQLRVPCVRSKPSCTAASEPAQSFTHILISNTQFIAYQNRTAQGLSGTCAYVCFICICTVYVCSLHLRDFSQSISPSMCPLCSSAQCCRHLKILLKLSMYRCLG